MSVEEVESKGFWFRLLARASYLTAPIQLVTVPSCASNGTACALNSACCSGRCDGVPPVCKAKLSNGSSCNENSDCRSGDCGDCNIFGTSCECT